MLESASVEVAVTELAALFRRNGYVRYLNARRRKAEKHLYKKGNEVRLVANSKLELAHIRRLLRRAGFSAGRPFVKGRQFRQPIYGREAVSRFLALVEAPTRRGNAQQPVQADVLASASLRQERGLT